MTNTTHSSYIYTYTRSTTNITTSFTWCSKYGLEHLLFVKTLKNMQITLVTNKHTLQSQSRRRRRRRRFIAMKEATWCILIRITLVLSWDINNDNTIDNTE